MTIVFKILRFVQDFSAILHSLQKMVICTTNGTKKYLFCNLAKTKFKVLMKNYLLANFRLHHFKSLGYRKRANIGKTMQICKQFVQKKFFPLQICFGKITLPQTGFFPNLQFSLLFDPAYYTYDIFITLNILNEMLGIFLYWCNYNVLKKKTFFLI